MDDRNRNNEYRPWLIFLIEEGFPGDLISKYRNDYAQMDQRLDNLCRSLDDLKERFRVAVLIYPVQFYNRDAYGIQNPQPMDYFHPALIHAMEFFEKRAVNDAHAIRIFLEAYSSGNATEQNGELSSLPPPPLYRGGDDQRVGLAMDMDAYATLKDAFPSTLAGIRFHEIYGSDLVMKLTGEHAFILEPEIVQGCIDLCHRKNLVLFWTDSCWLMNTPEAGSLRYVQDENYRPYFLEQPYKGLQDEAIERLGKNCIFSYANNNYCLPNNLERLQDKVGPSGSKVAYPVDPSNPVKFLTPNKTITIDQSLYFDLPYQEHPLKNFTEASWGVSIQSWFWYEMLYTIAGKKYYSFAEDDCPLELIASFSLKALREGAQAIQYEPTWWFFNSGNPHRQTTEGYEFQADYSARTNMKRLKQVLLNPEGQHIPSDPNAYFDESMQRLIENDASHPPRCYSQNTLGILFDGKAGSEAVCYDFYLGKWNWIEGDSLRIPPTWLLGEIRTAQRLCFRGNGDDALLELKINSSGERFLEGYRSNGSLIGSDSELFRKPSTNRVIGFATGNLLSEMVGEGDTDELILFRDSPHNDRIAVEIHHTHYQASPEGGLRFVPAVSGKNGELERLLHEKGVTSHNFAGALGIRGLPILYPDKTRPEDALLIFSRIQDDGKVQCLMIRSNQIEFEHVIEGKVHFSENLLMAAALDTNDDRKDELILLELTEGGYEAGVFKIESSGMHLIERRALSLVPGKKIKALFGMTKQVPLNGWK